MNLTQGFLMNPAAPVAILPTLLNFALCTVVAFVLRSFYIHRSLALTGKQHIASILPILACITFLVIVVVKSSLALSLGLVGALSIVRFRTPIKEPEELVYLFLAIAIGLGYAAGQTIITTLIVTLLFAVIYYRLSSRSATHGREYNLILDWQDNRLSASKVVDVINEQTASNEVVKYTSENGQHSLVLRIDMSQLPHLDELTTRLRRMDGNVRVNFFESAALW
jgi:hypothetical protein